MSARLKPGNGALTWNFAMPAEALIQIVCKNAEKRVQPDILCFLQKGNLHLGKSLENLGKLRRSCIFYFV